MEKTYKSIYLFFVGVLLVLILGFFKTYIVYFPEFDGGYFGGSSYNYIQHSLQHSHGVLMLTWISLLIIQPFLIKKGLYKTHRTIGIFSYVLVPLLLFSIFMVTKAFYYRTLEASTSKEAISTITGIAYIIAFAVFLFIGYSKQKKYPEPHAIHDWHIIITY